MCFFSPSFCFLIPICATVFLYFRPLLDPHSFSSDCQTKKFSPFILCLFKLWKLCRGNPTFMFSESFCPLLRSSACYWMSGFLSHSLIYPYSSTCQFCSGQREYLGFAHKAWRTLLVRALSFSFHLVEASLLGLWHSGNMALAGFVSDALKPWKQTLSSLVLLGKV